MMFCCCVSLVFCGSLYLHLNTSRGWEQKLETDSGRIINDGLNYSVIPLLQHISWRWKGWCKTGVGLVKLVLEMVKSW